MNAVKLAMLHAHARLVLADTLDEPLERDLEAGRAEAWELDAGVAYAITRYEVDVDELVVCALAGRNLEAFAELAYSSAQRHGVRSIRFHTRRPGLARMLKAYRPELAEYVYRVAVEPLAEKRPPQSSQERRSRPDPSLGSTENIGVAA